ncbi:MAG: cysteine--tRNA ligase [Candidatus Diapherotrites archaeon]|nr:cysteine--tRNA ligase [Candidatus Micrarchaeota archaeon]MBU1940131.1 cysteine--tRNA ligase [Candidatus Micrarchaeota archaeon]
MLQMYNSLSRKKEKFIPLSGGKNVTMYVCGPTVYGPGHIGHARTYTAFDIIRRYLEYRDYKVKFVMNITDVHDDMIKRANEMGITIFELADKNIALFFRDMDTLGIKPADKNPRVTETIEDIVKAVQELEKKGFAYETDDGVYFSVSKFKNYGKLSRLKMDASKTGTRVETDKYDKQSASDFALWKKADKEPYWDSPWGKGRPGWHIECSVMSRKFLGDKIDIHGGAVDLVFPHHENEVAQSEALTGKAPFVKYWMHAGFLNVGGEKMSKSLGNFIEIPDLLKDYNPKLFRFFVAGLHYRSRVNFDKKLMEKEKITLGRLNEMIQKLLSAQGKNKNPKVAKLISSARKNFAEKMDDDFNLPAAWAELFDFTREINKPLAEGTLGKADAEEILKFLRELDSFLGVFTFEARKQEKLSAEEASLLEQREAARRNKDFARADELRDALKKKGILLDDTPSGVQWKRA